ncbi:MAG: GNAT family N-acetyltransferase [Bacteroidota bacterium]
MLVQCCLPPNPCLAEGGRKLTHVRSLPPNGWRLWRSLRLQALADSPDAFGSTLEDAIQLADCGWEELVSSSSSAERVLLVAEREGRPVGIARVQFLDDRRSQADLFSVWVMPSERRLGVGRALVDSTIEWARSKGASEIVLSVSERSNEAKRLYLSSGFVGTGSRERLRPGSSIYEDAMVLKLS